MMTSLYDMVMNPDRNPLQALPKMVRFQYMAILAYMWSAVFLPVYRRDCVDRAVDCGSYDSARRRLLHG